MAKVSKYVLLVVISLVITYFILMSVRIFRVVDETSVLKTDHFLISYKGILHSEAAKVGEALEADYNRIRADLQDPEHEIIKVFIHSTQEDFNRGTGLVNSSANGTSRGPHEFHFLWTTWFNSLFPDDPVKTAIHEFTHCVQLNILINNAVGKLVAGDRQSFDDEFEKLFIRKYPQWFWEAICTYEANEVNRLSVLYAMWSKPSLSSLNSSNQIYNVGYTIIEYLVQEHGKDKLPGMITSYVDFEKVLGVDAEEFEKGWHSFVNKKYSF